jgi:hypothetical protein
MLTRFTGPSFTKAPQGSQLTRCRQDPSQGLASTVSLLFDYQDEASQQKVLSCIDRSLELQRKTKQWA